MRDNGKEKYTHDAFIKLFEETYQIPKRGDGSYYYKARGYTQKQIAEELLIDSSNFSKMINNSYDYGYITIIQTLKKQKEIHELKRLLNNRNHHQLTTNERKAVFNLHCELLQYKMAVEAMIFHASLKDGTYKKNPEYYLRNLQEQISLTIKEGRIPLAATQFKAENGQPLIEIIEKYSINNPEDNFQKMVEFLKNTDVHVRDLSNAIMAQIRIVQRINGERIDKALEDE